jgi:hypothetical protein
VIVFSTEPAQAHTAMIQAVNNSRLPALSSSQSSSAVSLVHGRHLQIGCTFRSSVHPSKYCSCLYFTELLFSPRAIPCAINSIAPQLPSLIPSNAAAREAVSLRPSIPTNAASHRHRPAASRCSSPLSPVPSIGQFVVNPLARAAVNPPPDVLDQAV